MNCVEEMLDSENLQNFANENIGYYVIYNNTLKDEELPEEYQLLPTKKISAVSEMIWIEKKLRIDLNHEAVDVLYHTNSEKQDPYIFENMEYRGLLNNFKDKFLEYESEKLRVLEEIIQAQEEFRIHSPDLINKKINNLESDDGSSVSSMSSKDFKDLKDGEDAEAGDSNSEYEGEIDKENSDDIEDSNDKDDEDDEDDDFNEELEQILDLRLKTQSNSYLSNVSEEND